MNRLRRKARSTSYGWWIAIAGSINMSLTSGPTFHAQSVIFAAVLPFALYHRIQSHTGEKLDRWQEGAFIRFGLRLSAVPFFVGSIAWMINPQWMAWSSVPISKPPATP